MEPLRKLILLFITLMVSLRGFGVETPPENAFEIGDHCWYLILSEEDKTAVFAGVDPKWIEDTNWEDSDQQFTVPAYVKFPDHGETEYRVVEIGEEAFTAYVGVNPMMWFYQFDYQGGSRGCMVYSVDIPETVTKIGGGAFSGAGSGFSEFHFTESVTEIESGCFDCSHGVKQIFLPKKLKKIPGAFAYLCKNLKECEIPAQVEEIGNSAFFRCYGMERVFIPTSVRKIGEDAFTALINLEKFEVDPANEYYSAPDGILLDKEGKTLVAWPFKRTDVVVPEGVETIQGEALNWAYHLFESIELPASIRDLSDTSFSQNTGIKRFTIRAEVPPACGGDEYFPFFDPNVAANATLYVPAASVEAYRQAPVWGEFKDIRAIGSDAVEGISDDPDATEAEYFTLGGVKTGEPAHGEITVCRQNGKATLIRR